MTSLALAALLAGGNPERSSGGGSLLVLVLAALFLYLIACVVWPFVNCPAGCERGKRRSPSGRAWRSCWWCKGKGSRVRLGRRLFEAVTGRRKHTEKRGG